MFNHRRNIKVLIIVAFVYLQTNSFSLGFPLSYHNLGLNTMSNDDGSGVMKSLKVALGHLVGDILEKKKDEIAPICYETLYQSYVTSSKLSDYFFIKLFSDSSKNNNDVSTYSECMRKQYKFEEAKSYLPTYLVSITESIINNDTDFNHTKVVSSIFGICAAKGCTDGDYKTVVRSTNEALGDILNLNFSNFSIMSLSENDDDIRWKTINFAKLIPFYIMIILLLFAIFNGIPFHLFSICYREKAGIAKKQNISVISSEIISYPNKKLYQFKAAFSITENGEELFKNKAQQGEINHDMGLTYIKGIRGLSMIILIFGYFFFDLYNSPVAVKGDKTFSDFISGFLFSIFFFGLRYSPKILFSCSGYCLFYKFICYLDEKSELALEKRMQKAQEEATKDRNDNGGDEEDANISLSHQLESPESETTVHKQDDDVSYSFLGYFYLYQLHKYLMYVIAILFMKYSLYHVALFFKDIGPMWLYFNNKILENSSKITTLDPTNELLEAIGLVNGFIFPFISKKSFLNYFWIIENEMIYFIITTLIIFLGYKLQFRSDRTFLFSILILFFAKIGYYIYSAFCAKTMNATLYFYYLNYGMFSISPYYNIIYYFIGVYFSIINYSIQKGITYDEADRQDKPFLLVSVKYANLFKRQTKKVLYCTGFIGFIILFVLTFFQPFIIMIIRAVYSIETGKALNIFMNNAFIKVFYIIDGDIVLFVIHCICLACYVKGDNLMNSFLSSSFWSMYNQFYFSFILMMNPVILYILYQSETRISFDFWNCFFYSMICEVILVALGSVIYIFYEAPMRKMFRLILHFKQNKNDEQRQNSELLKIDNNDYIGKDD